MLFNIFLIIGLIYTAHLGLYAAGANIYDIRAMVRGKNKKASPKLPVVSVVMAAYNEAVSIEKSIDSVWQSAYPHLEILVVNDGSKDATYELVAAYMAKKAKKNKKADYSVDKNGYHTLRYPKNANKQFRTVRLLTKPNGGKSSALNLALHSGVMGEFVMTLDADSRLDRQAVRRAVEHFDDETVAGVAANVRVLHQKTVLTLVQQFEHLIGYRSKKFYQLSNSELIIGGVASTYRRSVLEEVGFYDTDTQTEDIGLSMKVASRGNKHYRLVYAPEVLAFTQGVQTFKALLKQRYRWKMGNLQNLVKYSQSFQTVNTSHSRALTFYRVPMAYIGELLLLFEPFVLSYVVYLSFVLGSPILFIGSYLVITAYVILTIVNDEHFSVREKLHLITYAPVVYFLFYIMDLVQVIAIIRCLLHPKQLLLKTTTDGRWVSPERVGFKNN